MIPPAPPPLRLVLAMLAMAAAPRLAAQLTVTTASSSWTDYGVVRAAADPAWDTLQLRPSVDFVGDDARAAFLTAVTGDEILFRFRLNTPANVLRPPGDFNRMVAVGIDLNGNGHADIAAAVAPWNTPGAAYGRSYFARFGESRGDADDRWNLGLSYGSRDWVTSGPDSDFNYSLVSAVDGAVGDIAGSAGPNTLLTFSVSFGRLQDAIRALGGQYANFVVDAGTALTFRFSGHSGTLPGSANVDYVVGGQIVPEASTIAFLALALGPVLCWQGVRRFSRR